MNRSTPIARRVAVAARAAVLALMLGAAAASFALPVGAVRIDDLLPMAAEVKKSLDLTPNQHTLWLQVEAKSRAIVRERQARRERLQQNTRAALEGKDVELRDIGRGLDAEAAISATEESELRESWLTMNDALDEAQRRKVAEFFAQQLMRVADGAGRGEPRARAEGGPKGGGARGGRPGGGGGMGMPGG